MNKIFCVSCGCRIEYATTKPKFCSGCGEPIDGSQRKLADRQDDDFEEESDIDIESLRSGIEAVASKPMGFTIGGLMGTATQGDKIQRSPSNDPEGKELLQSIVRECASSKKNPTEING